MQGDITPRKRQDLSGSVVEEPKDVSVAVQQPVEPPQSHKQTDPQPPVAPQPEEPSDEHVIPDNIDEKAVSAKTKIKTTKPRKPIGVIVVAILLCSILIGLVVYGAITDQNNQSNAANNEQPVIGNAYTSVGISTIPEADDLATDLSNDDPALQLDLEVDLTDEALGL